MCQLYGYCLVRIIMTSPLKLTQESTESVSHSVVSDSSRLLCPWNSPGKNARAGSHSLLQEIFLAQGSNPQSLVSPAFAGGFFTSTDHVPLEAINKELSRHESNSQQARIMELSCEESCCSAGNNQAAEQAGITQHSWQLSSR